MWLTEGELDRLEAQAESLPDRLIVKLGGWEVFQSIKPYLARPRDSTVADEMVRAEWAYR